MRPARHISIIATALMACAVQPAMARLTSVAVEDKPLSLSWKFNWDGQHSADLLPMPGAKYWKPVSAAIVAMPPFPQSFDDLTVELVHLALGPEEVKEGKHQQGKPYRYTLSNVRDALKDADPQRVLNLPESVRKIEHLGTDAHHDAVRIEYQRIGNEFRFHLIANHVSSPIPEPSTWAMIIAGLAAWGLWCIRPFNAPQRRLFFKPAERRARSMKACT